jgi:hypothetical protein
MAADGNALRRNRTQEVAGSVRFAGHNDYVGVTYEMTYRHGSQTWTL